MKERIAKAPIPICPNLLTFKLEPFYPACCLAINGVNLRSNKVIFCNFHLNQIVVIGESEYV